MDALTRLGNCGVVPVVVLDDVNSAVPVAEAMKKGSVDVMEITLRTPAGMGSISEVAKSCPDVLVGAGTVITLEQCREAVDAGAKFIVSPGFDTKMVEWCVQNGVPVAPGCVTPSEIMQALSMGIDTVKFFPANVYGGLSAMKALAAPFGNVKFIPTGGVSEKNLSEYMGVPYIHAVGGSWLCAKADIAAGDYEKITALCAQARRVTLGFELAHVGINCKDSGASMDLCRDFEAAFDFKIKEGNTSNFASDGLEVMKEMYLGANGHIAIRTASIQRAIAYLEQKGYAIDPATAKYKGTGMIAVYLKKEFGGFAVHLLQK